ncbi:unnamed protein product [Notodromas monacha]|uniref:Major facilitator superfamily (MFS) profile domain-containing protein n=1 Tax=Notodromas monacha TaxID=399045 RepID=A0A7R9BSC3_9CRUS|nr:unnamed protein product [Notodromas monacha]CAG0919887.1 unnamed protein product [Notodromas monacha]
MLADLRRARPKRAASQHTFCNGHSWYLQISVLGSLHHVATGIYAGFCGEYTSVAIPSFLADPRAQKLAQSEVAAIVSTYYAGLIVGYFFGAFVAEKFSKRVFLLATFLPMAAAWLPFCFVTSLPLMIIARLSQGLIYC